MLRYGSNIFASHLKFSPPLPCDRVGLRCPRRTSRGRVDEKNQRTVRFGGKTALVTSVTEASSNAFHKFLSSERRPPARHSAGGEPFRAGPEVGAPSRLCHSWRKRHHTNRARYGVIGLERDVVRGWGGESPMSRRTSGSAKWLNHSEEWR